MGIGYLNNSSRKKWVLVKRGILIVADQLSEENEKLKVEIQKLRDENNRLKGEQGKPNIRGNKDGGKGKNLSSEKERKKRKEKKKKKSKSKKKNIRINRSEVCEVDQSKLPADAEFKSYERVLVQEILIKTDNVEYNKERFYSPSEKRTYVGELPPGIAGEFGPGIRSLHAYPVDTYRSKRWTAILSNRQWREIGLPAD